MPEKTITEQLEAIRIKVGGTIRPFPIDKPIHGDGEIPFMGGLLVENGSPVFIYIRDQRFVTPDNPEKLCKIHFSVCKVIDGFIQRGTLEARYHVTNRTDNRYPLDVKDIQGVKETFVKLLPCRCCLEQLDYKGYVDGNNRSEVRKNFDAQEAMVILNGKLEEFHLMAEKLKSEYESTDYAPNHAEISYDYRKSKNFTCEDCGVNLSKYQELTDMHHKDGDKRNNADKNKQCLCKLCHRKVHEHYPVTPDIARFIKMLRRRQNVG